MDDDEVDLEALLDLATPWCLRVVATLGIPELMAGGREQVEDLAAAAGCDARALAGVLGHLAHHGVVRDLGGGRFGPTPATERLGEMARFLSLDGIGGRMAGAWASLLTYVRTGRPGYAEVFGLPWWDDLAAHPDLAAEFDALMGPAGHGTPDDVELAGGWDAVRTVVDVGGGTGAALAQLLRLHPGVRGVLVDLPGTVARSDACFADAGVTERVSTVGQSFFDPLPAGADVYLLRKVLNDWPEAEQVALLRRCAEAAGQAEPPGRVVVVRSVVADGTPRGLAIETLLLGGVAPTLDEFRRLAEVAGLTVVAAGTQASGDHVVECATA